MYGRSAFWNVIIGRSFDAESTDPTIRDLDPSFPPRMDLSAVVAVGLAEFTEMLAPRATFSKTVDTAFLCGSVHAPDTFFFSSAARSAQRTERRSASS